MNEPMHSIEIPEPKLARFLFADTRFGWIWIVLRLYVGYQWLMAGWEKITGVGWVGAQAGTTIQGFLNNSLTEAAGAHPAVSTWYAYFISNIALPHATLFSFLITWGELAVGIALILGAFTGIAAFFGLFMNFNYLFAGTVSINPLLILIELFLILAWRNAGWFGLDRILLPIFGVPWQKGKALHESRKDFSPMEMLLLLMGLGLIFFVVLALAFR